MRSLAPTRITAAFIAVLVLGLTALPVHASFVSGIEIDPGPIGDMFTEKTIPIVELNGDVLNGQHVHLDLVFTHPKHLEFLDVDLDGADVTLTLQLDAPLAQTPILPDPTGYLSDEFGQPVLLPSGASASGIGSTVIYSLTFFGLQNAPIIFHDVHAAFDLPDDPSRVIQSATLHIMADDGGDGKFTVGHWVPLPAAVWPALVLFCGLGAARKLRRRLQ